MALNTLKEFLSKITINSVTQLVVAVAIVVFPVVMVIAVPTISHAQNAVIPPCPTGTGINCPPDGGSINSMFVTVINWALAIAFILAVIFLIYGGFRYILSGGNEESAKAGRQTIFNALIGVVIIVLSYVIVQIVYKFVSGGGSGGSFGI